MFYTFCGCVFCCCCLFVFFSNLFQSEKICLEKLKAMMLSGTYCIHVDSGHERQHFPWYIVHLPTEWREKLERVKRLYTATEFLMINMKSFSGMKFFIPLWRRTSGKTGNSSVWFLVLFFLLLLLLLSLFFYTDIFPKCSFIAHFQLMTIFFHESQEV